MHGGARSHRAAGRQLSDHCTDTVDRVRTVVVQRRVSAEEIGEIQDFVSAQTAPDGRRPLSDHLWIDLLGGGRDGFVAVIERDAGDHRLVGYAQGSATNEGAAIEVVVAAPGAADRVRATRRLLEPALAAVIADGMRPYWMVVDPDPADDRLATQLGLAPERTLLQLRRPLPSGQAATIGVRPFVVGRDEDAWLTVNNRAFAGHPEQGAWDRDVLAGREAEDWFDPAGFLLHERDGRLAGFCWTKVHHGTVPVLGEIYVIAVDPDYHGLGLGRELTLAGLDHLARAGIRDGMLFVDADNAAAVGLYTKLGFERARVDRAYAPPGR